MCKGAVFGMREDVSERGFEAAGTRVVEVTVIGGVDVIRSRHESVDRVSPGRD